MSIKSFIESPIIGRGIDDENRIDVGDIGSFGYGIPGLFARFGLIFSVFYLFYLYKGYITFIELNKMSKNYAKVFFLIINLGLLSQVLFYFSTFIYFFYLGLFRKTNLEI